MARAFQFDVGPVVEQLNRILQMELAAVIYDTHYSSYDLRSRANSDHLLAAR